MRKGSSLWLLLVTIILTAGVAQAKSVSKATPREQLYIDATIDNRTPYVGQEVLLTYTLFFSDIAPRISDTGKAEHAGLWVQEVTPERYIRSTAEVVNGKDYRKAVIKRLRLVPIQAGKLTVTNYRLRCFLPQTPGPSMENLKDIESVITAPAIVIDAKPLPNPVPQGFSGAVGKFSISLATDRYLVHAGEPVAISVKISGKGNLKTFPPVALSYPKGFSQLAPAVPTVLQDDAGRAEEAVTTQITLVPEQTGTFSFRPVSLTAFDPWTGRYETLTSDEVNVTVLPGNVMMNSALPDSLPAGMPDERAWMPPVAMIAMAAGFVLLIAILYLVGARQRKQRAESVKSAPEQPSEPVAMDSAESLRRRLYETLRSLGIPNPAGMTSLQLKKALTVRNIKPEYSEALLELLKKIDHAVYTPGTTSRESIEKLNRNTNKVIESLSKRA
ncbi:MAG: protein BatD [Chlorobiaceae bacterium]|nr:protein BatD [Chlorobiaceae bacterium]NTW74663.1 protein BatD [Chlorobiaceae bacterium]